MLAVPRTWLTLGLQKLLPLLLIYRDIAMGNIAALYLVSNKTNNDMCENFFCPKIFFQNLFSESLSELNNFFGVYFKTENSCSCIWTTGMKVWIRQSALAYLVLANIQFKPEPLYFSSSKSGSTYLGEFMTQSMWSPSPRPLASTVF